MIAVYTNEIADISTLFTDTSHFCITFLFGSTHVGWKNQDKHCNAENLLINNKFQFLVDYHDMERAVAPMIWLVVAFRVNFK